MEAQDLQRVSDLLGGASVLRRTPSSQLEAHELILDGLPGAALQHLLRTLTILDRTISLESAVGMSRRTFQRRKDAPAEPLSKDQSQRTWDFAEVLAKATNVLGSQAEAEEWLGRPAVGLNGRRPLDLLATSAGARLVQEFLDRLEYGVYT